MTAEEIRLVRKVIENYEADTYTDRPFDPDMEKLHDFVDAAEAISALDSITREDAHRLLFAWGEARSRSRQARTVDEQMLANDAVAKAHDALASAADALWAEWLAEQSR